MIQSVLLVLMFAGGLLGWLFPPVARVSREYHAGKDHFEWIGLLRSPDEPTRHQAVLVLCEMLRTSPLHGPRFFIVQSLGDCGKDAEAALPVLRDLLSDEQAALRWTAEDAIRKIEAAVANTTSSNMDSRLP